MNLFPAFALMMAAALHLGPAWSQTDWRLNVQTLPSADMVLLGEQHDAPEHQELARLSLAALASAKRLSALVLEMADAGVSTVGLSPQASEATARDRLKWNDSAWPWRHYGPVVMQAVRAGVPVVGANLPRSAMAAVMRDTQWDAKVPPQVLREHRERMVQGHCGLLPASQVPGMARIQIARDERMAQTATQWLRDGQSVLLLAGAEHVKKDRGIPLLLAQSAATQAASTVARSVAVVWMQAGADASREASVSDLIWPTPAVPFKDHCAALAKTVG